MSFIDVIDLHRCIVIFYVSVSCTKKINLNDVFFGMLLIADTDRRRSRNKLVYMIYSIWRTEYFSIQANAITIALLLPIFIILSSIFITVRVMLYRSQPKKSTIKFIFSIIILIYYVYHITLAIYFREKKSSIFNSIS